MAFIKLYPFFCFIFFTGEISCRCTNSYTTFSNVSCFKVIKERNIYENLTRICSSEDGYLADIRQDEENFVFDLLSNNDKTIIELSYNDKIGNFTWSDGSVVNSTMLDFSNAAKNSSCKFAIYMEEDSVTKDDRKFLVLHIKPTTLGNGLCKTRYFNDCIYSVVSSECNLTENNTYLQNFTVELVRPPELQNDPSSCNVTLGTSFHSDFQINRINSTHCILWNMEQTSNDSQLCDRFTYNYTENCTQIIDDTRNAEKVVGKTDKANPSVKLIIIISLSVVLSLLAIVFSAIIVFMFIHRRRNRMKVDSMGQPEFTLQERKKF